VSKNHHAQELSDVNSDARLSRSKQLLKKYLRSSTKQFW